MVYKVVVNNKIKKLIDALKLYFAEDYSMDEFILSIFSTGLTVYLTRLSLDNAYFLNKNPEEAIEFQKDIGNVINQLEKYII